MAEVARARIGLITYLTVPGSLADPNAIASLRETMTECVEAHELRVVADFTNVSLINSAALELLLDAQDQLARLGGVLKIANATAAVNDVMRITGVNARVALEHEDGEGGDAQSSPGLRSLPRGRLGDVLVSHGLVTEEVVSQAVAKQEQTGQRIGRILVGDGVLDEETLLEVLAEYFGLPYVRLRTGVFDPEVVRLIGFETARRLRVAPLFKVRGIVYVASADPQAVPSFDAVAELSNAKVRPVLACESAILETVKIAYGEDHNLSELIGDLDVEADLEVIDQTLPDDYAAIDEVASGSPVVNLINGLIQRAVRDGASDIHIEPSRRHSRVRFRIDGVLYQVMTPPLEIHPSLVSRLKVMANLDIAERRLPQDGRVQVFTDGRTIDLRFSSLPGIFGEKVVLRVLDKDRSLAEVDQLGMSAANLDLFKGLLGRNHGLMLVTGPTGSGKTTTLYAAIKFLNSSEKSIVTIEDPVEYQLDLINQNQVKEQVGLGFARILKHVLRQDPDIIMVGEIREREKAEIAVQAALTGHLVLSTLHTNDSPGAITRLLDMGVEPYLLSSALIGVMAQRLIRTVCPACRTHVVASPGSLAPFGVDREHVKLARGRGCPECYDSGYKGRVPIHEILVCDHKTQQLMVSNPTQDALAQHIREKDLKTLLDAGIACVLDGETTLEEVTRVIDAG